MENNVGEIVKWWLTSQKEVSEPKHDATYTIGWHIGSERYHEKSSYCLMELHNEEITIIGFGESIFSLKDKVEEIAKKYNAKILKQY